MSYAVVIGAGATGRAVARQLAEAGEQVKLVTRNGSGADAPLIDRIALDAADADGLVRVVDGARTLFNCAMPRYDRWPQEFPALAAGMLEVAERAGVDYVMLGNVYGYGPVSGAVLEDHPLSPTSVKGRIRAKIWEDALHAHTAGRVRATEVRASDFLGHGAYSIYNLMVTPNVLAGSPAYYPGDLDVAHSWTYTEDAARALIAASRSDAAWGKSWHVPPCANISVRELTGQLAEMANAPSPQLIRMTAKDVVEMGRSDSIMAEVEEMLYLFEQPFEMSAAATASVLSVQASPMPEVLRDTLRP
ncbi:MULTISPECIES: NAD-dependent epimerase/dehydratase family protein [unclassified Pseudoxanthomonas]|uniref:NAD-dependent epimerase/dehydratase family protein n=1 Tax=unclassified Pseudoxanthomonas TaxID=2645906 RepID=UPI00307690BD